jgi:4-hydroxy-3-polyprenylbenzoate decarboxylase
MRVVVGITGASGAIFGVRLLERLHGCPGVELHLVVSRAGQQVLPRETGRTLEDLGALCHHCHDIDDLAAPLASGSFRTDAMVIAPCSVRTMSAIATGLTSNLLLRAADVTLKERRRLILLVRETPLHLGHLRTMTALAEMGAVLAPPIPAFYHNPSSIMDLVDHTLDRILDLLGLPPPDDRRWTGA